MKLKFISGLLAAACAVCAGGGPPDSEPFILGVYSGDPVTDANFRMLGEAGINYVHSYNMDPADAGRIETILDTAAKYDMKVMFDLSAARRRAEGDWAKLVESLAPYREHPALGMWYLYDEPPVALLPELEALNAAVGKLTPEIPTALCVNWIKEWYKLARVADALIVDFYPVRGGQPFPEAPLHSYATFLSSALGVSGGRPVIGAIQAMSFECFPGQSNGVESGYRLPNLTEMRQMGFVSMALGARGILYFSFYHMHTAPGTHPGRAGDGVNLDWFREVFAPSVGELADFAAEVGEVWEATARDFGFNGREKVVLAAWERPGATYVVLANNTGEERDLVLDATVIEKFPFAGRLKPWRNTRESDAAIAGGRLRMTGLGPWETMIWTVEKD